MLDNILSAVRGGVEKVQRRSEEVTLVARLKLETYQLGRELEGHYARLGRAYHSGMDRDLLAVIQEDVRRTEEEIHSREALIAELGSDADAAPEAAGQSDAAPAAAAAPVRAAPASPDSVPPVAGPSASGPTGLADQASFPSRPIPSAAPEITMTKDDTQNPVPTTADPTVQHSDERLTPGDATASMGKEAERDKMVRHDNMVEEGKEASKNPDPLEL